MSNNHKIPKRIFLISGTLIVFVALLVVQQINFQKKTIPAASKTGNMLVRSDVRYCNSNNSSQEYDLYTPFSTSSEKTPLVVHIHGGGWRWGTKINGIAEHYAEPLTDRGIAFASIDYRLADEATYPAQNNDVRCAIEHLKNNASAFGIDTSNIVVIGDSAGGHLAALEGLIDKTKSIKGVVMFYGVSDLWEQITQYTDDNALHYLGSRDERIAKQASPFYQDLSMAPPFLLVHGTNDTIVPASESEKFTKALRKAGREATYMAIDGANHGFTDSKSSYEAQVRGPVLSFIEARLTR